MIFHFKKKTGLIVKSFIYILLLISLSSFVYAKDVSINSDAGILIDKDSGQILYEKNSEKKLYPASTTKIMTALLVLEKCDLDTVVTASDFAVMSVEAGSSAIALQPGEEMTIHNLLYALMLPSANDAANVLAEYVGGTIDHFAVMMTNRAKELGCTGTNFKNPNGLHNSEHYTTVKDMARIASYALTFDKSDVLKEIIKTKIYTIPPTNKINDNRYLRNTNALLFPPTQSISSTSYYYADAYGFKTGYTTEAGQNLVSAAKRGDVDLICVNFKGAATADRSLDAITLFNYGFDNYTKSKLFDNTNYFDTIKLASENNMNLNVTVSDTQNVLTKISDGTKDIEKNYVKDTILNDNLKLPITKGQIVGKIKYTLSNTINPKTYEFNLVSTQDIKLPFFRTFTFKILIIAIAALILLIIGLFMFMNVKSYNKKQRRKKMKQKYQYNNFIK